MPRREHSWRAALFTSRAGCVGLHILFRISMEEKKGVLWQKGDLITNFQLGRSWWAVTLRPVTSLVKGFTPALSSAPVHLS